MKWTPLAFLGLAATSYANPDGAAVTGIVKPGGQSPGGCSPSRDGKFQVTVYSLNKRDVIEKQTTCDSEKTLVMTLNNGVLKDAQGRTGYIASNFQFQFDGPPQAGAIYTAGFSTCSNGSLALGPSTVFYRCLSGNFYNLYDRHWAAQCEPINMVALPCDGSSPGGGNNPGNGGNGGHTVVGTSMQVTTIVTVLKDGQPQVVPTTIPVPMCQIGDGQVQVHTTPCASAPPITKTVARPPPVSQIPDGQPQAPTTKPQAPTTKVAPPPVSQIPDGQPQAPTTKVAPPPVTQTSNISSKPPPGTPTVVPTAAAAMALPGTPAVFVAALGVVLAL
ncbi:Cell wall mannoprotein CIS3 [Tolypocladium paradoxum]|uniref:Cell wall mannoprotein CIS3 n=1 Tax=Tolypocladium paradoxum TaxID=94208 RepID=A0A2S4KQI3_9HYPO|nr:Cell wall mannoprotein CIS3 [Tolypocladium paradoxum]